MFGWADGELDRRMPAGPSGHDFFERYDASIARIAAARRKAAGSAGTVAVVSHGAAIRVWAGLRARNMEPGFAARHVLANTGIVAAGRGSRRRLAAHPLGRQSRGRPGAGGPDGGGPHRPHAVAEFSEALRAGNTAETGACLALICITLRRIEAAMQTNPRLNIRQVTWANPVGADLRAAQQAELDARFGTSDHEPGPPPSEADTAVFLVAHDKASGQPVGCGGLRILDEHTAEIKRLYVLPVHPRLRGGQLHPGGPGSPRPRPRHHLHHRGGRLGAARRPAFLRDSGFEPVPNFGPYIGVEHSYCYAKAIDSHSAAHTAMA